MFLFSNCEKIKKSNKQKKRKREKKQNKHEKEKKNRRKKIIERIKGIVNSFFYIHCGEYHVVWG